MDSCEEISSFKSAFQSFARAIPLDISTRLCFNLKGKNIVTIKYKNKAISMMRGKSPRSDVEITTKKTFVAVILDF